MTINRRTVLSRLLAGLPAGYIGNAFASDAPESSTVRFGIIALARGGLRGGREHGRSPFGPRSAG